MRFSRRTGVERLMTDPKNIGDAAAGLTGFAAFFEWLPEVAAGMTVLWYIARFSVWIYAKVFDGT